MYLIFKETWARLFCFFVYFFGLYGLCRSIFALFNRSSSGLSCSCKVQTCKRLGVAVHNVITTLRRLKQEGCEFKVILGSIVSSEFKSNQCYPLNVYLKIRESIWGAESADKVLAVPQVAGTKVRSTYIRTRQVWWLPVILTLCR